METGDWTGTRWLTLFGDHFKAFVGQTPGEMGDMKEGQPDAYLEVFNNLLFTTRVFRCSARQETYNVPFPSPLLCPAALNGGIWAKDQTTVKWRCHGVRPAEAELETANYIDKLLSPGIEKMKMIN